jgi:4-hydroxybenzoate polyprenyltransferase
MSRVGGAARDLAALVKLSHSVFALPFALVSLLAATAGRPPLRLLLGVLGAVVAARTAAMAYNRLADRRIDAANPRTAGREIPRGAVSPRAALLLVVVASAAFLGCCAALSPLCLWLGLPTLGWLLAYSHVKRFSALCHLWLGVALGLAPVAAWVAADGAFGPRLVAPIVLGLGVACWVAGFDVLYAMQDVAVDVRDGLHSIPARLGMKRAAWISRAMHVGSVLMLVAFWRADAALGTGFGVAVGVAAAVIAMEHVLLATGGAAGFAKHFTTLNGVVSLVLGGAGIASIVASHG